MAKKTDTGNDVTFWNASFVISDVVRQNKWHFWDPETKLDKIDMFFMVNLSFKIWPIWPAIGLTLREMFKWETPSNFTSRWLIKHVSYDTRIIFSRWPQLTWPWPVISISLLLSWHLRHPFSSIFAELRLLSLVWSRQPIRWKESALTFDPTLNRHLTLLIFFRITLESPRWELSIAASRSSPWLSVQKLDRGGGDIRPPLSPQPMEVDWMTLAPRRLRLETG